MRAETARPVEANPDSREQRLLFWMGEGEQRNMKIEVGKLCGHFL
jgi:hypothetical protein